MNSFNHYAYGAVGDWMFQHLGGLQILEAGYKKFRVAPLVGPGHLDQARCHLQTPYGLISSEWILAENELRLAVTVPVNTSAEVILPAQSVESERERGKPISSSPGVTGAIVKDDRLSLCVGSGLYEFVVRLRP